MSERISSGACFCGCIVARMRGEPFWVCYDHDSDCRRAIGSPLAVWVGYRPGQIEFVKGSPTSYSKTQGVVRTFCSQCGTSIGYFDEGLPTEVYVALGFLDSPEHFRPEAHAYWREKRSWLEVADSLPRIDGYSRPRDAGLGPPHQRGRN